MTAPLGATFTEAPRSSGSSAPCPNALKVPLADDKVKLSGEPGNYSDT